MVEYDTLAVFLFEARGQELRIRFGEGYSAEVLQHWRIVPGQGIAGTAAETRRAVLVSDVRSDTRFIPFGQAIRSELAIPLLVKDRTIGVLDLGSQAPHHFSESHQRVLSSQAGPLANAIENARLYENLRDQARTLSLLQEVSRELTSILDWEELLRRVAQHVRRIIDYQVFCLLLCDDKTQRLEHAFALRYDEQLKEMEGLPLGTGICGTAAELRKPVRVGNVNLDPRYIRCESSVDVRSELAVPLVFKDRVLGVLDLESTAYDAFTEQHEQMLATLSTSIAIALENARLYEQVRRDERRMERDLAMARELQRQVLPATTPRVPGLKVAVGYQPARELGGDFYDFLPYGDGRLAVAVGDVAGKATAAALYGSLALGTMREHAAAHPCAPAEMLERLNPRLGNSPIESRFVALVFSVYEARERKLTLANAGFTRPLLLRNASVETIRVEGVPLGLLADTQYEEKSVALQPGDVVVFCSDGVHEAADRHQQEFGTARLEALLKELATGNSAQQIANGILRATDQHAAGNGGPSDDRTVVVLRVGEERPGAGVEAARFPMI